MEDLRTRKTKRAIELALMELIETKGFAKIKIKDIAQTANVNRNTIYLHYESKEAIVTSILRNAYGESNFAHDIVAFLSGRLDYQTAKSFLLKMLTSIEENIELYRLLMTDPNLNGYVINSVNIIRHEVTKMIKQTDINRIRLDFVISGIEGAITRWVIYATGSKEEVAEELVSLTLSSLQKLVI